MRRALVGPIKRGKIALPMSTFVIVASSLAASACATPVTTVEQGRAMVRRALDQAGGDGPITLFGARGVRVVIDQTDMQPRGVCGRALRERAVYADWVVRDVVYTPPHPVRCRPYEGMREARPGIHIGD